MSEKNASKTENETAESSQTIYERIKAKRAELSNVHAVMTIHMQKRLTAQQTSKINELQDRLEFRVAQYEEQLLEEKIKVYREALTILRT